MSAAVILFTVIALAFANGANDNFKGVATLFGSGTTDYKRALAWATVTTFLGSLTAVFLAQSLLQAFSGKGLVADGLVADSHYVTAVGLGAAGTVLLATRLGMPISTTHSLIGALVGAGLGAESTIQWSRLGSGYFLPLLVSPIVAIIATVIVYSLLRLARRVIGITEETCICIGNEVVEVIPMMSQEAVLTRVEALTSAVDDTVSCHRRYQGTFLGLQAANVLDRMHYLSSGVVSYARGLHDTPKIAALLLLAPQLGGFTGMAVVGIVIAVGGLISAKRVAETMSQKVTSMNHGQGFTANMVTGLIVIGANNFGWPVSTTHVSCGTLFGIGTVTRQAHWRMIGKILSAWITTLPMAALLGAVSYWLLRLL